MVVDRGDLEPAVQQLGHDRRDLGFEQHEVAHHHGLAMHRREGDPAAERQGRLDGDAVERDMQIGPRQSVAVDLAADGGGLAEGGVDLLPVDLGSAGGQGQRSAAPSASSARECFMAFSLMRPRCLATHSGIPAMHVARGRGSTGV